MYAENIIDWFILTFGLEWGLVLLTVGLLALLVAAGFALTMVRFWVEDWFAGRRRDREIRGRMRWWVDGPRR